MCVKKAITFLWIKFSLEKEKKSHSICFEWRIKESYWVNLKGFWKILLHNGISKRDIVKKTDIIFLIDDDRNKFRYQISSDVEPFPICPDAEPFPTNAVQNCLIYFSKLRFCV